MNKYILAIVYAVLLGSSHELFSAENQHGYFEGQLTAVWTNDDNDHRSMVLTEPFSYTDPASKTWQVPKSAKIDGASIPRVFWTTIGSPFIGTYRNASVVHDYYCDMEIEDWRAVHKMFYHAMLAGGTSLVKAKLMYYAVLVGGPRWKLVHETNHEPRAFPKRGDIDRYVVESWQIEWDQDLASEHLARIESENLSIADIESLADRAFSGVEPVDVRRIKK